MDPPELASEPPRSHIGAASNSAPELRVLGWVMLGHAELNEIEESSKDLGCCLRGSFMGLQQGERRARDMVMWHRQLDTLIWWGELLPHVHDDLQLDLGILLKN